MIPYIILGVIAVLCIIFTGNSRGLLEDTEPSTRYAAVEDTSGIMGVEAAVVDYDNGSRICLCFDLLQAEAISEAMNEMEL